NLSQRGRRKAIEGDTEEMYRLATRGEGVIISDNLALQRKIRLGQVLDIATPGGVLRIPVAGIVLDYSDQKGSLLIDRALWIKYWKDDSVNLFRVYLAPGASDSVVRERIIREVG